jgi:60 kDa SS-A/Ro ribonucleoprotein
MATAYRNSAQKHSLKPELVTPQDRAIKGREAEMTKNSAGGVTFTVTPEVRLDRFLILGSEGGSYYASARKLTEQNAKNVIELIKTRGVYVVNRIVTISEAGRAPKNDPALFALALCMTYGNEDTKAAAYAAIPKVARIGTHALHLAAYVDSLRGWGRGVRRGFGEWYTLQHPKGLATNLVKYANRDGWTHRDVLRLAHPKASGVHQQLLAYAAGKPYDFSGTEVGEFMQAVEAVKTADSVEVAASLVHEFKLPREVVPTQFLNDAVMWEALLPHMGMTALVRNLATLTRVGVVAPMNAGTNLVLEKLSDAEELKKSRMHPIAVLTALLTYSAGRGNRGQNTWTPVAQITDALDAMFYASFGMVVPTGKRFYLGIDISGSMTGGEVAGVLGLTPNICAAAMAMVTARTEKNYVFRGFSHKMIDLGITAKNTLKEATRKCQGNFGATDCAVPMLDALQGKIEVDTFVVYTDNETWAGNIQPVQALQKYRDKMGIPAKLVVVGMVANNFTVADPKDAGMLDVVGFDTATPSLISDFARD